MSKLVSALTALIFLCGTTSAYATLIDNWDFDNPNTVIVDEDDFSFGNWEGQRQQIAWAGGGLELSMALAVNITKTAAFINGEFKTLSANLRVTIRHRVRGLPGAGTDPIPILVNCRAEGTGNVSASVA